MRPRTLLPLLTLLSCAIPLQGQRTRVVHRTPGDTLANSYRIYEPVGRTRGLLVLLPGYGSDVNGFAATSYTPSTLPERMARHGVLTIVAVPQVETLYESDQPLRILDSIVAEVLQTYRIPSGLVVVGGFSAGGTGAVRYAQYCAQSRCAVVPSVAGVFGVDPPLDFERLYRGEEVSLRRGAPRTNTVEAQMIVDTFRRVLGGAPEQAPEAYRRYSPLLASAPDGGNAGLLARTPIRLYTEPDVQWWMENRNLDYHGMNSVDHAAFINLLRVMGNTRAELVTTTGKGVRPDGTRHPHSWSIVDEPDLAEWIARLLGASPAAEPSAAAVDRPE
jgi:pimeloyl-ACP methyl ester carboxylesterase